MCKVILFGGTTEGRRLADYCSRHHIETVVCVVSDWGAGLLPESPWLRVRTGAMEAEEMGALFRREKPALVVDATHPYAAAATGNIRKACSAGSVPCIRVVREPWEKDREGGGRTVWVETAGEAADYLSGTEGKILLTTGSKELPVFAGKEEGAGIEGFEERVWARVLPSEESIGLCRRLGVKASQIIAMQGPFSLEMNMAVLHMTGARWLVTKESGTAGGFSEKMEAAGRSGVTAVVIGRPGEEEGVSLREAVRRLEPYGESCPRRISLVGIGMGGAGQLTGEARSLVEKAQGIAGAGRMLDSVSELCAGKEVKGTYKPEEIRQWLEENPQIEEAAVLYSGDTGFYSGAAALLELLGKYPDRYATDVIPGISTVSCLCARLKTTWEDVYLGSLHGRGLEVEELLKEHERVFLLMGKKGSVGELCRRLTARGLGDIPMAVGMSLSYPEERIAEGTAREMEKEDFHGLCAVLLGKKT